MIFLIKIFDVDITINKNVLKALLNIYNDGTEFVCAQTQEFITTRFSLNGSPMRD